MEGGSFIFLISLDADLIGFSWGVQTEFIRFSKYISHILISKNDKYLVRIISPSGASTKITMPSRQ